MTLTLPFFREAPLPGVLQKTDPAQLLCRSPPRGQRRCASTGRSCARPILRQVQRLPPFCAATEGGVAGIILNMRICAIFRSRAASAKSRQSTSPRRVIILRRPCRLHGICPRSSRHAADFRFRPWLRAEADPASTFRRFRSFRSFRAPPRGKSRNSQSRGNKPRRAAFGQKKSPARGRAT